MRLRRGERWRYQPPAGHTILWLAVSAGEIAVPDVVERGEVVAFAAGEEAIAVEALADAEFVVGWAAPHPYDLALGYYSVHTSADALAKGEARIAEIQAELQRQGRL